MKCIWCKKTAFNLSDPYTTFMKQKIHRSCYGLLVEEMIEFFKQLKNWRKVKG